MKSNTNFCPNNPWKYYSRFEWMKWPRNQDQKKLFMTTPEPLGLLCFSTSTYLESNVTQRGQGHGTNPSAVSMHIWSLDQVTSVRGSDWCNPKSLQPQCEKHRQSAWNEDANLCNGRGGVLLSFSPACTCPLARPWRSAWWHWHTTAPCCWAAAQTLGPRNSFLLKT